MIQPPFQILAISRRLTGPAVLARSCGDERHALGVAHHLRRVERVVHGGDEIAAGVAWLRCLGLAEHATRELAFGLHARQDAGVDGRRDAWDRHSQIERDLYRPATCPLLPRLVEDRGDETAAPLRIAHGEDLGGDLDQERLKRSLVPFREHLPDGLRSKTAEVLQHVVGLGDVLHVGVLNTVVDHLDEMSRAVGTYMRDAGAGVGLRGDRLENRAGSAGRRPDGHPA